MVSPCFDCLAVKLALPLIILLICSSRAQVVGDERDQINRYLVEHVSSEDISENLVRARELLMQEESRKSMSNVKLIDALKVFISLDMIHSYKHCDMTGYQVLQANGITMSEPYKFNRGDRVSMIIFKQFLRHAQGCRPVYRTVNQMRRAHIVETGLARQLDAIMDSFITCSGSNPLDRIQYNNILEKIKLSDDLVTCVALRLFAVATSGLALKSTKEVPQLSQLAKVAMYQPCDQYVQKFHDIFLPNLLETMILPKDDHFGESSLSFDYGANQFRLCYLLIERSREARSAMETF